MASLSGYVLNFDAWTHRDPETKKRTHFKKGDELKGIEVSDETLEYFLTNGGLPGRPVIIKKESDEESAPAAPAQSKVTSADLNKK